MNVIFMLDGKVVKQCDMAEFPRTGETVWFDITGQPERIPTPVRSVTWFDDRVELRFTTGR